MEFWSIRLSESHNIRIYMIFVLFDCSKDIERSNLGMKKKTILEQLENFSFFSPSCCTCLIKYAWRLMDFVSKINFDIPGGTNYI